MLKTVQQWPSANTVARQWTQQQYLIQIQPATGLHFNSTACARRHHLFVFHLQITFVIPKDVDDL